MEILFYIFGGVLVLFTLAHLILNLIKGLWRASKIIAKTITIVSIVTYLFYVVGETKVGDAIVEALEVVGEDIATLSEDVDVESAPRAIRVVEELELDKEVEVVAKELVEEGELEIVEGELRVISEK